VKTLEAKRGQTGDSDYVSDIEWHFIGHLQTNKLKMVLPYVSLVQSVDSVHLLDAIESWASANGKMISVLLEPHVAAEDTKQGFAPEEIIDILKSAKEGRYPHILFKGIMGMATFTDDEAVIRSDFDALRSVFEASRDCLGSQNADFTELSIGMSDDYPIAIEYGSTMVRIGSMIFGERAY
jgi:pyridoxal phosphate enzyme (YggS family)